jgi:hypothetical protein
VGVVIMPRAAGVWAASSTVSSVRRWPGTFVVDGETVELNQDNTEHFATRWNIDGDILTFERDELLGISRMPFVLKPWTRQR